MSTVGILGLGLIGGSFAKAYHAAALDGSGGGQGCGDP